MKRFVKLLLVVALSGGLVLVGAVAPAVAQQPPPAKKNPPKPPPKVNPAPKPPPKVNTPKNPPTVNTPKKPPVVGGGPKKPPVVGGGGPKKPPVVGGGPKKPPVVGGGGGPKKPPVVGGGGLKKPPVVGGGGPKKPPVVGGGGGPKKPPVVGGGGGPKKPPVVGGGGPKKPPVVGGGGPKKPPVVGGGGPKKPPVVGGGGLKKPPVVGGGGPKKPPVVGGGGGPKKPPVVGGGGGPKKPPVVGGGGPKKPPVVGGGGPKKPPVVGGGGPKKPPVPKPAGGPTKKAIDDWKKKHTESLADKGKKLTPDQKKKLDGLQKKADTNQAQAKKKGGDPSGKSIAKTSKPGPNTLPGPVKKPDLQKDLQKLASDHPKLQPLADKLKGNQPLKKNDLKNVKDNLSKINDPKTQAKLAKTFGLTGPGISDNALKNLFANDKSPPLTPKEKVALDKYLHGEQLTPEDIAVLDNLQDRPPAGLTGLKASFAQMNRDIRDQALAHSFLDALTNLGGGLGDTGGGCAVYPGGGCLPGSDDCIQPMVPTCFYPNDPSVPDSPDDGVIPTGSGVCCCTTPNVGPPPDVDTGPDPDTDPGSIATQATALQTTRYLRLGNGTSNRITIYLFYDAQTDDGDWAWFPATPGSGDPLVFELDPGETVDAMDNDWRINANRVRIWATAEGGGKWPARDLELVPETIDGQHAYEADDLQVFNFTVR